MSVFNELRAVGVKNFVPQRANPLRLQNAPARRSFAEVPRPVAGLAAVGFVMPVIIGRSSASSKRLSTNSEILCQVRPAPRLSISSDGDPIGLEAGDGGLPRFAITGVTEAGEAAAGNEALSSPVLASL